MCSEADVFWGCCGEWFEFSALILIDCDVDVAKVSKLSVSGCDRIIQHYSLQWSVNGTQRH